MSGCLRYSGQSDCEECGFGTKIMDGKCEGVLFCEEHNEDGTCKTCIEGYDLSNNKCINGDTSCLVSDNFGACIFCDNSTILIGF